MPTHLRVVIVDDVRSLRAPLRMLLDASSDVEVVGEAENAVEAVQVVTDCQPDVILLDLNLGEGMSGQEVLPQLREVCPNTKVVVMSAYDDPAVHAGVANAGADAFVPKKNIRQLVASVRAFMDSVN